MRRMTSIWSRPPLFLIFSRKEVNGILANIKLYDYQMDAIDKMHNGCILCGGVGSGKSLTALGYFYKLNGGNLNAKKYNKMKRNPPMDLYIITTARKRDTLEWDRELLPFLLSQDPDCNSYQNSVKIDSWNNVQKYSQVEDAFFIFDEQRVVGKGTWVKNFLKITKNNQWILLSATPGDTWMDYVPVFLANGFYRNRTEFNTEHVIFSPYTKYPSVMRYRNVRRLMRLRDSILVDMDYKRVSKAEHDYVICDYDKNVYLKAQKTRWDIFKDEPIQNAGGLCYVLRRIVNSDISRLDRIDSILKDHPKSIIFYNFDYEREMLIGFAKSKKIPFSEWSGHAHEDIPEGKRWIYLVQYTAGCEGWNCIKTDTTIFYSQNYSYKVMEQACGRIARLNTPYEVLHYYHLVSRSSIDRAIANAIKTKKNFNERRFVKW